MLITARSTRSVPCTGIGGEWDKTAPGEPGFPGAVFCERTRKLKIKRLRAKKRIATASVRTGFTMTYCKVCGVRRDTWVPPYRGIFCGAGGVRPAGRVRRKAGGGVRAPRPTDSLRAGAGGPSGTPAPTEGNKRCKGRATARVAPTGGYKKCLQAGRCGHRPLRRMLVG